MNNDLTVNDVNGRILCRVRNCVYHDGDHRCTAEKISVGPTYASDCTETVCATFKPKSL